ncbi:hypothetical protein VZQ01_21190 [Myxococcus faecalis]|uniref:hypothetical protein n=1 Tax=Myxococcus faecalis TaxID=3115646 RepID=UPI003CF1715B
MTLPGRALFLACAAIASLLTGCSGPDEASVGADPASEATSSESALAACTSTTQTACRMEAGCSWNAGCCGGLCLPTSQTCPITCPPPES